MLAFELKSLTDSEALLNESTENGVQSPRRVAAPFGSRGRPERIQTGERISTYAFSFGVLACQYQSFPKACSVFCDGGTTETSTIAMIDAAFPFACIQLSSLHAAPVNELDWGSRHFHAR